MTLCTGQETGLRHEKVVNKGDGASCSHHARDPNRCRDSWPAAHGPPCRFVTLGPDRRTVALSCSRAGLRHRPCAMIHGTDRPMLRSMGQGTRGPRARSRADHQQTVPTNHEERSGLSEVDMHYTPKQRSISHRF